MGSMTLAIRLPKYLWVLAALALTMHIDSVHAGDFKVSGTGYQMVSLEGADSPGSIAGFFGESLQNFGEVGIYTQYIFPADELGPFTTFGLGIAPSLFKASWGKLLWSNKVGFGIYQGVGQIALGTGFTFEPGSFFHLKTEVLHQIEVKKNHDAYPTMFGLGIGFHFE